MVVQPTGTVTLLFTDIEGSTRLLAALGRERYAEALDLHRRLLREAFQRHGGYEVDCEGDAFFVAFSGANDAVAAAAEAQQALVASEWPDAQEFRVRIGIHTGEPLVVPPKYVGLDVHKSARIMAAGHGGQVLLSAATRRMLDGVDVVPLGEHRLKDLLQPEPLYQLCVSGMPDSFPVLKTLGNRPNNLPMQPNALIGRAREVAEVAALLAQDEGERLLTLTGVGGTGKTRVALQAAAELLEEFPSGVFFVGLAPIRDRRLVIPAVAQALAVREVAGEALEDVLVAYLEHKEMLLVLDNFEQVIEAAPALAGLMGRCPGLKVLVTSRERLRVASERAYALPPLRLPEPSSDLSVLASNEAVGLFAARASAASGQTFVLTDGNAATVAEICICLEGLPLAIELAAAWVPALPPEALLARLDRRLSLLTRGSRDAEERQRTLRNTIEWSYDLLSVGEQKLFTRLAVFVDGCRLKAVEAVCDRGDLDIEVLSGLTSLVEKSLVRQRSDLDGEPRFWMFETIREFASQKLTEAATLERLRAVHADYFLAVVRDVYSESLSLQEEFERLVGEQSNVQTALEWAEEKGEIAQLAAAVADLWRLWRRSTGQLEVGVRWAEVALAHRDSFDPDLAVRLLGGASELQRFSGDKERAKAMKLECVELAKHTESRVRLAHGDLAVTHTLADLADMALEEGNLDEAHAYLNEGLALGGGPRLLGSLATIALLEDDLDRARRHTERAAEGFKAAGHDYNYAAALSMLGEIDRRSGDRASAFARFSDALLIVVKLGDEIGIAQTLDEFAVLAAEDGDLDRAARLLSAATNFGAFTNHPSSMEPETIKALPTGSVEAGQTLTLDQAVSYALLPEEAHLRLLKPTRSGPSG